MKRMLIPALLGSLLASSNAFAKENIALAMSKVYGHYNQIQRCWVLKDDFSYCMKIAAVNSATDEEGRETVYLLALGDAIEDDGHVHAFSSGGRAGMIVYQTTGKDSIKVLASEKNESAGMDGWAPPAENFSFTKIGPERWAWRFDDEEGRQGLSWKSTTFYSPYKGRVQALFSLGTESAQSDYTTGEEKITQKRSVQVKTDEVSASGFYPIEVEVTKTSEETIKPGKYLFRFSSEKGKYKPKPGSSMAIDLANQGGD